jgi:hypothetical protein
MNVSHLEESTFRDKFRTHWGNWQQHINYYPDKQTWWERYAKRMTRLLFLEEVAESPPRPYDYVKRLL